MKFRDSLRAFFSATILSAALLPASHAVDAVSFEFGTGNHTQVARLGLQWQWNKQWWQSNGTHIGGYWDLSISQWHGQRYRDQDRTQNLAVIGITPVFRFQNDSLKGFYVEAGIGANLTSSLYNNNGRRFASAFQFGDHIGFGYVFSNDLDIGLRLQHFSNGGIKRPNPGVNFALLRASYRY